LPRLPGCGGSGRLFAQSRQSKPLPTIRINGSPPPAELPAPVEGSTGSAEWRVPEETPVAFIYNQRNYAVMLATPMDLADFAVGFSLTERVVDEVDDIRELDIGFVERGVEFRMKIAADRLERLDIRQQRRNLVGRAGCGVCGLENADTFFETLPRVAETRAAISETALKLAMDSLADHQPLNRLTHTVHAAAWADVSGAIRWVREDVGRHNALDKLLGAMALAAVPADQGFVMMSSRCSYEIIEKSARRGVRAVATLSGPTSFALRKARECNMAVYCRDGARFVQAA